MFKGSVKLVKSLWKDSKGLLKNKIKPLFIVGLAKKNNIF